MKMNEHKQLKVDEELLSLCEEIQSEGKSDKQWAEIESCNMLDLKSINDDLNYPDLYEPN